MFSLKTPKNTAAAPATSTSRLDLHPVTHIADCLLDYQKQLSTSEVHSLDELQSITRHSSSFWTKMPRSAKSWIPFMSCSAMWTGLPVNLLPSNLTLPALSVLHSSVLTD